MSGPTPASSGIHTFADGQAYIPSSKRADGSTRREIKVRPGYKPPEDVERYKSRNVEISRARGPLGVPGVDEASIEKGGTETKSKNAKRREAARKRKELENEDSSENVADDIVNLSVQDGENVGTDSTQLTVDESVDGRDSERQKKIRNQLKKLKAIRELKSKKTEGEKLAADQLVKISKEQEIMRDLIKLEYDGPEIDGTISAKGPNQPD